MKKVLLFIGFFALSLTLSACGEEEDHLNHIKTTLEGIGYVFEQRDADAIEYYNNKAVNEEYDIDVTLTDLYIGYIDDDHWLELLVFENDTDADEYIENSTESGYIIYREGNVLFITFYDQARAAFNEDTGEKG